MNKKKNYLTWLVFGVLLVLAIVWIMPIIWGFLTSFKSEIEVQTSGFNLLPIEWIITNYKEVLLNTTSAPLVKWFTNSLFVSGMHAILAVFISSMAAYAYSRLNFKGKDVLFWFLLSTMMFPRKLMVQVIGKFSGKLSCHCANQF